MRLARLLAPLFVLVLLPSLAAAFSPGGVAIRWDQCYGDAGVQNKNFACDTNDGSETLACSFVLTSNMADVGGLEIVIDMAFGGPTLPAWWQLRSAATCRQSSLTVGLTVGGTNCPDWSSVSPAGGIGAYNIGQRGPNTSRIRLATAVPLDQLHPLSGLTEYAACLVVIDHAKTVGAGACGGCATPACILLKSVNVVTQVLADDRLLTGPANFTDSDWVTWQGGGGVVVGAGSGCPAATPTQQRTWGAVNALYH